jgi:hypothetical protein
MVDAECIQSTAIDINYFKAGGRYTIDMEWAKARGIWGYFRPLREIPKREVEERNQQELELEKSASRVRRAG